jgi:hypothetical protein
MQTTVVKMNKILFIVLMLLPAFAFADSSDTGFFQTLWDFIDWIYEAAENIQNSIVSFFIKVSKIVFLFWLKIKISVLVFVWNIVSSIIQALNLSDIINASFSALRPDWQAFIIQMRIGEGINILLSARVTRAVLDFIRW